MLRALAQPCPASAAALASAPRGLARATLPAVRGATLTPIAGLFDFLKSKDEVEELNLSDGCKGAPLEDGVKLPIRGTEAMMSKKKHGTTDKPVQEDLRYGCDRKVADNICSFNRHYAEYGGYWETTEFLKVVDRTKPTEFYDSVTGNLLFTAPIGRSWEEFEKESRSHGWPSFRDEEVNWEYVRVLPDGEAISTAGTHLGHNLPDRSGNRYCINLVSVAGNPTSSE